MENNNQDLLCCVRDMFGGCAGTPSSPNLRYMFAAVMQKDTDGCFSLKTSPVLESFDIVDCNNTISTVQSSGVVIEGVTAPIPVCVQGEKDFAEVYKCDASTGNTILIRTTLDHDTNAYTTTYFDLVLGAVWAGDPATDLTECDSNTLESDFTILCDDNGEFYRWFVKDNGEPTGVSYDTDMSGALYTPVGAVGICADTTKRSETHNYIQLDDFGNYTGRAVTETRTYDDNGVLLSVVYTDTVTGAVVALQPGTTQLAEPAGHDTELVEMCDNGTTFLRKFGFAPGGQIVSQFDIDADGNPYTVVGTPTIGVCPLSLTGGGMQFVGTGVNAIPADTHSFTVTAHSGKFDVSFDSGATWDITDSDGVKTWDSINNAPDIRVRGSTATSNIKINFGTV